MKCTRAAPVCSGLEGDHERGLPHGAPPAVAPGGRQACGRLEAGALETRAEPGLLCSPGATPLPRGTPRSGKRGRLRLSCLSLGPALSTQNPRPAHTPHSFSEGIDPRPQPRLVSWGLRSPAGLGRGLSILAAPWPLGDQQLSAPHSREDAGRAMTPMAPSVLNLGYDHHEEASARTESQGQGVGMPACEPPPCSRPSRPTPGLATHTQDARHRGPSLCDHKATQCPLQTHWSWGRCPLPVCPGLCED